VWILLFVLVASNVIEAIPLAVLAGLLAHVGINLVNRLSHQGTHET
jgi:carbonic anhydrase